MAILNQKRILNLIPKVSAPVTIHVSQGDVGTQIEFTLVKGDEVFVNPGNVSASVHGVREDGANFGAFTCTLSGSKVTFPLHSEMTAVKGSAVAEIVLVDNGGNKVGSANFGILVEESVFPLGVTYDNDVSVYESILAYVQTIPAQLQSSINSLNTALNSEIGTRQSADAFINTRIDEIIAPSGEAPSAAEVQDARIGANGVKYSALGNAIRKQIESIRQLSNSIINNDDREQKMILPNFVSTDILDLADGSGKIVTAVNYRGDIKAPNFDSTRVIADNPVYTPKPYDFIIQDINNNIVFGMLYGKALSNARLHGKKLSIVGDSISTYANYSPGSYYPNGDVNSVRKTWWHMLADELGMEILKNTSRSNTTVTGDSEAVDAKPGCSTARINELKDGDVTPDIVICYMSTNDWGQNHEIGAFTSHDTIPSEGLISDICPAYALMLYKIRTTYPNALVYCITNLEGRLHSGDTTYPVENSQGETIHDVNHAITEVAHIFGCHIIDLNTSGIHFWNISDYSLSGTPTHPNAAGMVVIKETVKQKLIETV